MKFGRIIARSLSSNFTNTCQTPRLLHKTAHFSASSSTPASTKPNLSSSVTQSCNGFVSSRDYTSSAQESKPSERVSALVDEISGLTLLEVSDLTEILRKKMNITEVPMMGMMMPGAAFKGAAAKGGGPGKAEEKKAEKTAFDLKLEGGFEAGVKIKIIKEVRACTELGLKEAKDLVEKAPTLLKKGVTKEEAEKIIEKLKAVGAKVTME